MIDGWTRVRAFLFDYLLVAAYLIVLAGIGTFLTFGPLASRWSGVLSTPVRTDLMSFLLAVLPVTLYFAISESSAGGATWGKKRMGIRVVGQNGGRLSRTRSLSRSCLKFLPWQMAHTAMLHIPGFPLSPGDPPTTSLVLLGAAWLLVGVYFAGLSRLFGYRTLYDHIVGSSVVARQPAR